MGISPECLTLCLVLVFPTFAFPQLEANRTQSESQLELLDDWLQERQLDRLSIRLAETRLARELDAGIRKQLAAELAERYRVQCFSNLFGSAPESLVSKAETLIQNYPEVKTPGLELAISHAQYLRAEREFLAWWRAGAPADRRGEILGNFQLVLGRLQQQIDWNNSFQQRAFATFPDDEQEIRIRQQQLDEIESRIVHANYLLGWTGYFLAIVPIQNDSDRLVQAQSAFYRTLRIEQEKTIDQIDSKWLDFSSPLSRQTLLGLGLVYEAQKKSNPNRFCLAAAGKLGGNIVDLKIWQFNAFAYSKQWAQAVAFANSQVHEKPAAELASQFWNTVVEAGFAGSTFDPAAASELQRIGLRGLLRQFDAEAVKKIVEEKAIQLSAERFEDLWIMGLLNCDAGEGDPQRLVNARDLLQQAVKLAVQDQNPGDVSRIHYLQALIELKLQNPLGAIAVLEQMPDMPGTPDLAFSENVVWLECRAMILLSQTDSLQTGQALAALDDFVAKFRQSKYLPQAEFERLKLSNSLLPADEALEKFSEIQNTDFYFHEAQFEMVRSQYRIWENAHNDCSESEAQAFEALVSLDQQFRELPEVPAIRKLASLLLVIDASLNREPDKASIDRMLVLAGQISLELPIDDQSPLSQLMYYRFLAARKFGDDSAAGKFANWISEFARERGYQLAAIAFLAKAADESGNTSVHELIELYQKLTERLGTDKETIASSGNARAAAGRLVELFIETNQPDEARRLNTNLLEWNASQEQFVLNAARIEMQAGNLTEALANWRKLAQGSETGTPTWLESKLGIVSCLVESDPELAAKVFRQTVNLAGEFSGEWQNRFADMGAKLGMSKTAPETGDPVRK